MVVVCGSCGAGWGGKIELRFESEDEVICSFIDVEADIDTFYYSCLSVRSNPREVTNP